MQRTRKDYLARTVLLVVDHLVELSAMISPLVVFCGDGVDASQTFFILWRCAKNWKQTPRGTTSTLVCRCWANDGELFCLWFELEDLLR
jgi:hypothetical protein